MHQAIQIPVNACLMMVALLVFAAATLAEPLQEPPEAKKDTPEKMYRSKSRAVRRDDGLFFRPLLPAVNGFSQRVPLLYSGTGGRCPPGARPPRTAASRERRPTDPRRCTWR